MAADELFEKGVSFLRDNNSLGALACFEKACNIRKTPELQSYIGFCIAMERGQITEALSMCNEAISKEPNNPVLYLNLGRVYLKAKRKDDAIEILRKGLSFGDNPDIRLILESLGLRKKPFFTFLPRGHFLNKYAGLFLIRLKLR